MGGVNPTHSYAANPSGIQGELGATSGDLGGVFPSQAYAQPSSVIGRTAGADAS
jgi:hypothetical protein